MKNNYVQACTQVYYVCEMKKKREGGGGGGGGEGGRDITSDASVLLYKDQT